MGEGRADCQWDWLLSDGAAQGSGDSDRQAGQLYSGKRRKKVKDLHKKGQWLLKERTEKAAAYFMGYFVRRSLAPVM